MIRSISARKTTWLPGMRCGGAQNAGRQRRWYVPRRDIQLGKYRAKIVCAIVVVALDPEQGITIAIAGGNEGIMNPTGRIFDDRQDWAPPVGTQAVAQARRNVQRVCPGVFHRHAFAGLAAIEGPGVDYLFAVRIDDLDVRALWQHGDLAFARRYFEE